MKKFIVSVLSVLTVGLTLAGCSSSNDSSKNSTSSKPKAEKVAVKKQPKYYFKDNVAEIHDVKVEITKVEVKTADETNGYSEKPLIVFHYKATNKTNKEIDPISAWQSIFSAYQDNDKNSVNELEVGSNIDDQYLDTQSENIKKGGTVENETTYELDDMKTPVELKAKQGYDDKVIGSKIYQLDQQ